MTTEQACIHCPSCLDNIALPHQSHLGKFDNELSPSKDIWPILYLCLHCGRLSEIPAPEHRPRVYENTDPYQLVRYDFASAQSDFVEHCAIYTKESAFDIAYRAMRSLDGSEAVEKILKVSKMWKGSYENMRVSIDMGIWHSVPKKA